MHGVLQSRAALAVGPPRAFAPILRALAAAASPSPQRAPPQTWPSSASATRPGPLYPGYSHLRDASWKNERLARCNLSPCALPACTSCSAAREAWPQQWCGRSTHCPACWCGRTSHSMDDRIASSGCCRRRWQRVQRGPPLRCPHDSQTKKRRWQRVQHGLPLRRPHDFQTNGQLARCNLSPCALPACTSCSAAREAWPQQWCGRSTHRPACWCGRTSHSTNGHIASSGCCRRRWQRVLHGTPLRRPRDSQSNWQLAQCNLSLCALPACTSCSAAREAHPQCWCAHSSSAPCDHVYTSLPMDDRSASRRPCPRASPGRTRGTGRFNWT